jgi:hypothetical protein
LKTSWPKELEELVKFKVKELLIAWIMIMIGLVFASIEEAQEVDVSVDSEPQVLFKDQKVSATFPWMIT